MLFKNILFGLGGTAVIGGVGYGIYAASQSKNKDVQEGEEESSTDEAGEKNGTKDTENKESESGNEGGASNSDNSPGEK